MLIFIGVCLLVIAGAGTLKTVILRSKGVATEAKVIAIEQVRDYSSINKFRPDKFEIKLAFSDPSGKSQTRDVVLSMREKKEFRAEMGSVLPLVYVPDGKSYSISREIPGRSDYVIVGLLFFPAGLLIFMGIKVAGSK